MLRSGILGKTLAFRMGLHCGNLSLSDLLGILLLPNLRELRNWFEPYWSQTSCGPAVPLVSLKPHLFWAYCQCIWAELVATAGWNRLSCLIFYYADFRGVTLGRWWANNLNLLTVFCPKVFCVILKQLRSKIQKSSQQTNGFYQLTPRGLNFIRILCCHRFDRIWVLKT